MKYLITILTLLLFACGQNADPNKITTPTGMADRLAPNPHPNNHAQAVLRGDCDGNLIVDMMDFAALWNSFYGGAVVAENCDINCDGTNANDADFEAFGFYLVNYQADHGGDNFCPTTDPIPCQP